MRNWGTIVGVAIVGVLAYQGYANIKDDPTLWPKARVSACFERSGCGLPERPNVINTDVFKRSYGWRLGGGWITVDCRRDLVLFGPWYCARVHEQGSVAGDKELAPLPQEIERGVPNVGK